MNEPVILSTFRRVPKGQLISKCLFSVFNFLQKTNKNKSTWGIIVNSNRKWIRQDNILRPFLVIFHQLYDYLSQNWGSNSLWTNEDLESFSTSKRLSESHFLKMKIQLAKKLPEMVLNSHLYCLIHFQSESSKDWFVRSLFGGNVSLKK